MQPLKMSQNAPALVTAASPFDKQSADLVLQTSDGVAFHVWRCILAEASPVFADMFSLAARTSVSSATRAPGPPEENTTLNVPETSRTVYDLLRMCNPPPHAQFESLDKLKPVLAAAHKYQMDGVMSLLASLLLEYAADAPLRVYAIATQYDLHDVMSSAARRFLVHKWALDDYVAELDDISAGAYQRLLAYRKECAAAIAEMCTGLSWLVDSGWTFMQCQSCPRDTATPACRLRDSDTDRKPTTWFWQHYERMATLLQERPCSETLSDPLLINQALKIAILCKTCMVPVHEHMLRFMHKMRKEVSQRISEIKLDIK
ncbi:hypothetical protein OH77DRAFT_803835 [Trametes cingulata]|nr:hypothetical protein OH77DRAFT_803835 [Trametes cingulata]